MRNFFKQKIKVQSSQLDLNSEVGLVQSMAIVQDNMCEYFKQIKCDGPTIIPQYNCFYVLTKSKGIFNNFFHWSDEIELTSKVINITKVSVTILTKLINKKSGEIFAECKQELCAMDNTSRRLKMVSDTPFPTHFNLGEIREKYFDKLSEEFTKKNKVKTIQIESVNIDIYKHTNNVEYIRFLMSTFDKEFLINSRVVGIEIHYISESTFGDVLEIYRKQKDNQFYFEMRKGDKVVTKAVINFEERK